MGARVGAGGVGPSLIGARMLEQILADPADDALRLVYADQLLARGDIRGEYIAVEAQLAAAARGSTERAELARRRGALRRKHGRRWWPNIPDRRIGTRYGFAETAAVLPSELDRLTQIAAREPISALELIDHRGSPLPADAPWQRRIRRLVVHRSLDGDELSSLLQTPLCEVVEELAISSHRAARWPPFAGHLPRCRHLCLSGSHLEDADLDLARRMSGGDGGVPPSPLRALAGWDHAAALEVLDLSHCWGSTATVRALASLELSDLRVLRMSGSWIDDDGALELASQLSAFPALERLELADTRIGEDGAEVLRSARTRAELVLAVPAPSRMAIDAVGIDLELFQVGELEWAVAIDGVRRPIRLRLGDRRERIEEIVDSANLGLVVRALATGARRHLLPDGMLVSVGREHLLLLEIAPDRTELRFTP